MPYINIDNDQIHYKTEGEGDAIILLLPQSSGPNGIQQFVKLLGSTHCIISYDQRSNGKSSASPADVSMQAFAKDAIALLDALGKTQAHFLCHSTGCGIGTALASLYPDRVNGLILVNPWTHADGHLSGMQKLRQTAVHALDSESYARFNHAILFPPAYRREYAEAFTRLAYDAVNHPVDADRFCKRLDAILAFDARLHYPKITCPTLVAAAIDDQLMPSWFGTEATKVIKDSELVEFSYGGHMLPETRAVDLASVVLGFMERFQSKR